MSKPALAVLAAATAGLTAVLTAGPAAAAPLADTPATAPNTALLFVDLANAASTISTGMADGSLTPAARGYRPVRTITTMYGTSQYRYIYGEWKTKSATFCIDGRAKTDNGRVSWYRYTNATGSIVPGKCQNAT